MRLNFLFLLVSFAFAGCTKYEEDVITGNIAPPDPTVDNALYEDYVNRSYILALGHEPTATQLTDAVDDLKQAGFSMASRESFLNTVFSNLDYKYHEYEENRFDLLQSNDSAEIQGMIFVFNFLLADTTYMLLWPQLTYEVNRLVSLSTAKSDFVNGTIEIKELHRRMVDNYLYDQINMGSQNFVLAVFQQLINRQPTQNELAAGVAMVDGVFSVLFLQTGGSKNDFLDIVFATDNYYEGQVYKLYQKYLLRPPNSVEMTDGTTLYTSTNDYVKLQIEIMKSDEFAGLD